jgi:hypothetical protein
MKICDHHIEQASRVFSELDGDSISVKKFAERMFVNYFDALRLLQHLVKAGFLMEVNEGRPNQTGLFKHKEVLYEAHS